MHILFLTDNFPPEVNAPASRTFEHCAEWVKAGHKVTVVTGAPNFPKGQVFAGYRNKLWQREVMGGIDVVRVWTFITANEGFVRRVLDYTSYMCSAIVTSLFIEKVDVVVGTSPQFFTACAGYVVGLLKRRPFVFELRDLWPETIKAVGAIKWAFVLRWLEALELFLYRRAALIVSVTESFKKNLADRGIDPEKMVVVTNGVDMSRFKPIPKDLELVRSLGVEGKFVAGYVGTHGMCHGLETLLEVADEIRSQPDGADYHFVFLGDGARKEALVADARSRGLDNVTFLESVSKDQVPRYWSILDASLIHLQRSPVFETVIPSKLFECMGMGIPVLHGVAGESAEIVRNESVGVVFEPENAGELVAALEALRADPKALDGYRERCLQAAPKFAREAMAARMLEALVGVAVSRGVLAAAPEADAT